MGCISDKHAARAKQLGAFEPGAGLDPGLALQPSRDRRLEVLRDLRDRLWSGVPELHISKLHKWAPGVVKFTGPTGARLGAQVSILHKVGIGSDCTGKRKQVQKMVHQCCRPHALKYILKYARFLMWRGAGCCESTGCNPPTQLWPMHGQVTVHCHSCNPLYQLG